MKKIFTLIVVATGTISIASAQSKKHESVAYNDSKKMSGHHDASFGKTHTIAFNDAFFSYKAKQAKLEAIDREYDKKIALVKSNRHLTKKQKAWEIRILQDQKKKEISKVEFGFTKSKVHDPHKW
jgi:hypothetical protein